MYALKETHFTLPNQTAFYKGKVRDVYTIDNTWLVMVVSDRISAFDVVLPEPIPCKGQVLNQIAAHFLASTSDIVPNWVLDVPDPNVSIGKICRPFKVEMVIRGYLSGHAWREYQAGKRMVCGVALPDGLRENDAFPEPIITPTTKADVGHDMDISREEIISRQIVKESDYILLENFTRKLFSRGTEMAAKQGLLLVDTKYEFGQTNDGNICLIDEIHTPDSSRYFYKEGYEERQQKGEKQKQLSKEFVREWLIENNFMGKEGQQIPSMKPEKIQEISKRYIELFEAITGQVFTDHSCQDMQERVEQNILKSLEKLQIKG